MFVKKSLLDGPQAEFGITNQENIALREDSDIQENDVILASLLIDLRDRIRS